MNILGLDQSYTSSGVVILNSADKEIVWFGVVKSDPEQDEFTRALDITKQLLTIVDQHSVNAVMMEGLAFGSRGDATRKLAGLQFTIATHLILTCNMKCELVSPTTLKKFATGSGKADKKAMMTSLPSDIMEKFIQAGYKKTKGLPDLTDAYFIAKYAASR